MWALAEALKVNTGPLYGPPLSLMPRSVLC